MRKILTIVFFVIVSINILNAQNDRRNWIGINASISTGELVRFGGELDGGVCNKGQGGFLVGIVFLKVINERFDFETGFDFSRNSFTGSYTDDRGNIHEDNNPKNMDLLSVPLNIKIKLNNFFVSTGIQYDQRFDITQLSGIDSQTGIGLNLRFGRDFKITEKMILFIAPEIIIHGVVPIFPEQHQQRLIEFGLRVSYKFGL